MFIPTWLPRLSTFLDASFGIQLHYAFLSNILKLGLQRWIKCLETTSSQLESSLENKVAK